MYQFLKKYTPLALLAGTFASPLTNVIQQRDTFEWGSLGDSWASGVSFNGATTDYDNNTNGCLRWKNSYGPLMEADTTWTEKPQDFHFAACSGAWLVHIKVDPQNRNPPQMQQVGSPMMLTYHAGGNNIHFGKIVTECLYATPTQLDLPNFGGGYDQPYPDPSASCTKDVNWANGYINNMNMDEKNPGLYLDELRTIRDILAWPTIAANPDFRLYVLGYAHFFNLGPNYCDNISFAPFVINQATTVPKGINLTPPKVTNRLRTDFNDAITRTNNILQQVVNDLKDSRVKFIDISPKFDGHRFCEDHHKTNDQWYNPDVWLWNLNFPVLDPPNPHPDGPPQTVGTDGIKPSDLNGTVGVETDGSPPFSFIQRPFHPKIGGTTAIKDLIIAAAKADRIPGVVTTSPTSTPSNSIPIPSASCAGDGISFPQPVAESFIDTFCREKQFWNTVLTPAISFGTGQTKDGRGKALAVSDSVALTGTNNNLWAGLMFANDTCIGFFPFTSGQTDQEKIDNCKAYFDPILNGCQTNTTTDKKGGTLRDVCAVYVLTVRPNGVNPFQDITPNLGSFTCKETDTSIIGGSSSPLAGTCTCWYANYPGLTDIFKMPSSKNCADTQTGDLFES